MTMGGACCAGTTANSARESTANFAKDIICQPKCCPLGSWLNNSVIARTVANKGYRRQYGRLLREFPGVPEGVTDVIPVDLVVAAITEAGLRGQVKVMIGGAPVTQAFADEIGADGYGANAGGAIDAAKALLAGT